MLIATPYRDFDVSDRTPPRIISEIRKTCNGYNYQTTNFRVKLTGDLLVKFGNDRIWWPRRVSVRCGQLLLSAGNGQEGPSSLKIPLRHFSLKAGALPNSLALCRGQIIVITIQTASQKSFDEWAKTIAIELIRQTPLDAIKYLDILTIAECWNRRETPYEKDWHFNERTPKSAETTDTCSSYTAKQIIPIPQSPATTVQVAASVEEGYVEDLLKKCQNSEKYVPVKEKLFLFESLCKLDRKVRSTEDVSLKVKTPSKRARSLHDLSNLNTHIVVREICKYFEDKNGEKEKGGGFRSRRLIHSDSQLNDVHQFRKVLTT